MGIIANYFGRDVESRHIRPGSVSHGTMRNADLMPVFANVLDVFAGRFAVELAKIPPGGNDTIPDPHGEVARIPGWATAIAANLRREWYTDPDSDDANEAMVEAFDALNAWAPVGCYFSAHEGDGSDYGFWSIEDERCAGCGEVWPCSVVSNQRMYRPDVVMMHYCK